VAVLEVNQIVVLRIRNQTSLVRLEFQVRLTKRGLEVQLSVKAHLVEVGLICVAVGFDYRKTRVLYLVHSNWLD